MLKELNSGVVVADAADKYRREWPQLTVMSCSSSLHLSNVTLSTLFGHPLGTHILAASLWVCHFVNLIKICFKVRGCGVGFM